MSIEEFRTLMQPVTELIGARTVDRELAADLNRALPASGEQVAAIEAACHKAIEDGWMCSQGEAGRRFGRIIEPGPESRNLSVDVVELTDIVGPHHRHPTGEICLVMPQDADARFGGHGAGWCVFPAGSAHQPTVKGGCALILYLLPNGEIEFLE